MKRKACLIAVVILMLFSMQINAFSTDSTMQIVLNGSKIDAEGMIDGRNIYLPLRAISEQLGAEVEWSGLDSKINIIKADKKIIVDLKNYKIMSTNGHTYYMSGDDVAKIVDGKTFIGKSFFEQNFGLKIADDITGDKISIESIVQNEIKINNINETQSNDIINITLNYPQIDGLGDNNISDKINAIFKQAANSAKSQGIKNAQELSNETQGFIGTIRKCETYFDYRIKYNQNGLLSLILLNYQYLGGAHGSTIQKSYTFDLKTGEEITLKSLMKPDSNYILTFNKIVNSEIIKRELFLLTPFENIKDDEDFYLSNQGVCVYFQQYEYFPYAAGIQSFTADYSVVKDMLNSKYSFLNDDIKILDKNDTNVLNINQKGKIVLKGNPTTGYTWQYKIENTDIIKLESQDSFPDSSLVGAQSTFIWNFKALKEGQTKITFKYYRDWEKESSTKDENIVEYIITVSPSDSSYVTAPFYQSKVVYEKDDGLYCTYLKDKKSVLLVKGKGILHPLFSNDGSTVTFLKGNDLYAYDFSTYHTKLLIKDCLSFCANKDNKFLVSTKKNGIVMIDPKICAITILVPALNNSGYDNLKISPDDRYLAYSFTSFSPENKDNEGLWLYDTTTCQKSLIVKDEQSSESSLGTMTRAGKWSPDSKQLFVWLMARSASLNADGVSTGIYDIYNKQLIWQDVTALAYDNNVSFANADKFALICGGSRMMFENKTLNIFEKNNNAYLQSAVEMNNTVTTSPCYSQDGEKLVFAASPQANTSDDYKTQIASILKRQIYLYKDEKVTQLTDDAQYGCETPLFLNNDYILFAKTSANNEKSIWIMKSDGSNQSQIVKLSSDDNDKAFDFYGRIDWSSRFTLFDGTKNNK